MLYFVEHSKFTSQIWTFLSIKAVSVTVSGGKCQLSNGVFDSICNLSILLFEEVSNDSQYLPNNFTFLKIESSCSCKQKTIFLQKFTKER